MIINYIYYYIFRIEKKCLIEKVFEIIMQLLAMLKLFSLSLPRYICIINNSLSVTRFKLDKCQGLLSMYFYIVHYNVFYIYYLHILKKDASYLLFDNYSWRWVHFFKCQFFMECYNSLLRRNRFFLIIFLTNIL